MRITRPKRFIIILILTGIFILTCGTFAGYKIGYSNAEMNQEEVSTEIIEIVDVPTTSIEPVQKDEPNLIGLGYFDLTAYCPCKKCCGKSDGITASGTKATAGRTIAADTRYLPFGTEVYIYGQKYIVEDRGGAIKGKHIDIYFDTHEEALKFGRKQSEVFVTEDFY